MDTELSRKWKRRSQMVKGSDPIVEDPLPTDIIIPYVYDTRKGSRSDDAFALTP